MATGPVRTPATYADILALPRHVNGQIVDGELEIALRDLWIEPIEPAP